MTSFYRGTARGGVFVESARFAEFSGAIRLTVVLGLLWAVSAATPTVRAGTLLDFNTQLGSFEVDLFDELVPETVFNFMQYVNGNGFTGTLIHGSLAVADSPGIGVIQGGGYTFDEPTGQFIHISTLPEIALQYSRANTRGTIAMTRGIDANTATSEWFINTANNSTALGPANGGGYAVLGWVVGPGMSVVDSIATLPKLTVNGLTNFPLQNYNPQAPTPLTGENLVFTNSVTVVKTHPSFQNPYSALDVNNNDFLQSTDALAIISELLTHGSHTLNGPFSGTAYLDTDGNGRVNSADALLVISALLNGVPPQGTPLASPSASPDAMAMASFDGMTMLLVPEPSSLTLLAAFTLSLGGFFLLRKRAWHRHARPAA